MVVRHWVRFFLLLALSLTVAVQGAVAQPLSVSVSPQQGSTDDLFLFAVTVREGGRATYPVLSGGNDFSITLLGPRVDEDGSTVIYEYNLAARRTGLLQTPRAQIEIGGNRYESLPLQVLVNRGAESLKLGERRDIFVRQQVLKTELLLGEQFLGVVELFTSVPVFQPYLPFTIPDGLFAEPASDEIRDQRTVDGERYNVLRYQRVMYPTRVGTIELPAAELRAQVRSRRSLRDPIFGLLNTFQLEEQLLKSNPVRITVRALPPVPPEIARIQSGPILVGNTSIQIVSRPLSAEAGAAKQLRIEISSAGNVRSLNVPTLPLPAPHRVYPEGDQVKIDYRDGRVQSRRIISLSIVPLAPGILTVPEIQIPYFDTRSNQYKVAATEAFSFPVAPSDKVSVQPTAAPVPTAIVPRAPTAAPDAPPNSIKFEPASFFERISEEVGWSRIAFFLALLLGAPALVIGAALYLRRPDSLAGARSQALQASTIAELQRAFISWIQTIPGAQTETDGPPSPARCEGWRSLVLRSELTPEQRLLALQLIDDLFAAGKDAPETVAQKEQLLTFLNTVAAKCG